MRNRLPPSYGLITRPRLDAERFGAEVAKRGIRPVIAPILEIQFLPPPPGLRAEIADSQALIFTSANGVRAFTNLFAPVDKPVFAVGNATATLAHERGFSQVETAGGDANHLACLIIEHLNPKDGPLFQPAGTISGRRLRQDLHKAGFRLFRIPLYRAPIIDELPQAAKNFLNKVPDHNRIDSAFFFSPRSARSFVSLVKKAGLSPQCARLVACALSPAAATPLRTFIWRDIITASHPETQSLLDGYEEWYHHHAPSLTII